jgi:hypothetical protein
MGKTVLRGVIVPAPNLVAGLFFSMSCFQICFGHSRPCFSDVDLDATADLYFVCAVAIDAVFSSARVYHRKRLLLNMIAVRVGPNVVMLFLCRGGNASMQPLRISSLFVQLRIYSVQTSAWDHRKRRV